MYLRTTSDAGDALELFHMTRPAGHEVYGCSRLTTINGQRRGIPNLDTSDRPTAGKKGQLRIARKGAEVTLSTAGPDDDRFRELYHLPLGPEDINMLRIGVNPGNAPNPLDVRLIDLRIRSNLEKADVSGAAWNRPALWIAVILVLAGLVVGGIGVVDAAETQGREGGGCGGCGGGVRRIAAVPGRVLILLLL
jgi:hypothetical protein